MSDGDVCEAALSSGDFAYIWMLGVLFIYLP